MILQIKDDKEVARFETVASAIKATGITSIYCALQGRYEYAGGFKWRRDDKRKDI